MAKILSLNPNYSTTRLCYKLLDKSYLDNNYRIKEELKFKINNLKFKIQNSKLIGNPDDKFETMLFLPEGEGRKGEGGLRTKGYFKFSYKKVSSEQLVVSSNKNNRKSTHYPLPTTHFNDSWYIVDEDDNPIEKVELPENILQQLTNYQPNLSTNKLTNNNSKSKIQNPKFLELPLITIITVVYNGEKYLEETIQSVINQTYPNVEYIIIDGGSTDGTLDIIKKYEDYIDYWVSEKDNGIYDAMNKGIILATGKLVGLLNSDDWYELQAIEKVVEAYNLRQDVEIIHGDMFFYKDNKPLFKISPPKKINKIEKEMIFNHPTCFVCLLVYKQIGVFNLKYKIAADYEFLLRSYKSGKNFFYIDEILANMRYEGESDKNALKTILEEMEVKIKYGYSKVKASLNFMNKLLKFKIKKIIGKDHFLLQIYRKLSTRKKVF